MSGDKRSGGDRPDDASDTMWFDKDTPGSAVAIAAEGELPGTSAKRKNL